MNPSASEPLPVEDDSSLPDKKMRPQNLLSPGFLIDRELMTLSHYSSFANTDVEINER